MSSTPSPLSSRTASPLPIWVAADTTLLLLRSYNEGDLGRIYMRRRGGGGGHTPACARTHTCTQCTYLPLDHLAGVTYREMRFQVGCVWLALGRLLSPSVSMPCFCARCSTTDRLMTGSSESALLYKSPCETRARGRGGGGSSRTDDPRDSVNGSTEARRAVAVSTATSCNMKHNHLACLQPEVPAVPPMSRRKHAPIEPKPNRGTGCSKMVHPF